MAMPSHPLFIYSNGCNCQSQFIESYYDTKDMRAWSDHEIRKIPQEQSLNGASYWKYLESLFNQNRSEPQLESTNKSHIHPARGIYIPTIYSITELFWPMIASRLMLMQRIMNPTLRLVPDPNIINLSEPV